MVPYPDCSKLCDMSTELDVSRLDKMQSTGSGGAVSSVFGRTGAVVSSTGDYGVAQITGAAPLASPTFTGTVVITTVAADDNSTKAASTAYVLGQASSSTPLIDGTAAIGTSTRWARGDHVHPTDTTRAALASPTFTGTPAAPTAAVDTNTTQLATTAFVLAQTSVSNPVMDGTASAGTSTRYARSDHVHPSDTSRAALASPTFTGTPAVPTATPGTNTTQAASTAFVTAAVAAGGGGAVSSVFTRTGAVVAASGDYTVAQVTGAAPLASPALTGTPTVPTAAALTNTTQAASTAYADAAVGVEKTRALAAEAVLQPALTVTSVAFASTVTPATPANAGELDLTIGTLTGALALANPTGTPAQGSKMTIWIVQDGTGRVITPGTAYAFGTDITLAMLPITANAKFGVKFAYNATDSKWRCVGLVRGF